jgi:hypothetical protein
MKQAMLSAMCQRELAQADLKAIGRSRGFDAETTASRVLLQHAFLSEQGLSGAMASLTETEILGLHLLHHRGEAVELEYFQRIYPDSAAKDRYVTYTARFKGVLQKVKANLVRRGLLLFHTLPQGIQNESVSERMRFLFPEEFAPFLPAPFPPRSLGAAVTREHRKEVTQPKLMEILKLGHARTSDSKGREDECWSLTDGELLFGGKPFSLERFRAWPVRRLAAGFPGVKEQVDAFRPVPMLLYALSRLGEDEWAAPDDLLPFWKLGLPGGRTPEPRAVCDAGFECGLLEAAVQDGTRLFRWRGLVDTASGTPPEHFLAVENSEEIRIDLERVPLEALARLSQVSHLRVVEGRLRAAPSHLKISHTPAATLESEVFRWLRQNHTGFRTAVENIEEKRGKLIVHENLLVAKVNDPALQVTIEREFAAPGQLVELARGFVAFPTGLLPRVQAWMRKSGHVIRSVSSHDTDRA